jgi:hypothetical protein
MTVTEWHWAATRQSRATCILLLLLLRLLTLALSESLGLFVPN